MDSENPRTQDAQLGAQQPPVYAQHSYTPVPTAGQPDAVKRFLAILIDGIAIAVLSAIVSKGIGIVSPYLGGLLGSIAGLGALLLRDVAFEGRSLGKKVIGLNVVTASGGPITPVESVKRNLTLSIGSIAGVVGAAIPLLGLLLMIPIGLVGLAVSLYEAYLVVTNQPRLGDKIAGTKVIVEGQPAIAV